MTELQTALDALGYSHLRPFQEKAIDALMANQDVLLIAPTGGGKSFVYQAIGVIKRGVVVVVSPLIALMEQQVELLNSKGIPAAFIHGNLNPGEQADLINSIRRNHIKFLYLSPEKLVQPLTLGLLESIEISLFAIDEAHCIVQWGGHFRPEYRQLGLLKEKFKETPFVALTGTVGQKAIANIKQSLNCLSSITISNGFNRDNIAIKVAQKHKAKQQLLHFLHYEAAGQSGIVYCRSRSKTEEMAAWLTKLGFNSLYYHAGMSESERAQSHNMFQQQNGFVMFATTAYGMGLDIQQVRFVVHLDLPSSPEAYWQEIGRAGRDNQPAKSLLLYGLQDMLKVIQFHERQDYTTHDESQSLYDFLQILESRGCRKQNVLSHFSESIEPCGQCDRCQMKRSEYNATTAAQKLLSLVYYTKGVEPFSTLIQILLGKNTKRVNLIKGQNLTLFNKGRELSQAQWKSLARHLVAHQYLCVQMEPKCLFYLNDNSRLLLQGKKQVILSQDHYYPYLEESEVTVDTLVWHRLMRWKEDNPQIDLSEKQLKSIFTHRPANIASLSRLTGISQPSMTPFWSQLNEMLSMPLQSDELK